MLHSTRSQCKHPSPGSDCAANFRAWFLRKTLRAAWSCVALSFCVCCLVSSSMAQDRWASGDSRDRMSGAGAPSQSGTWVGGSLFGAPTGSSQWNLGVLGDSTETGFRISQVTAGAAASRARIEPGDVIVTVEGYQVGLMGGRLYDLADEVNRRADSSGAVRLLLQDGRTGRLASVRVQLDNQSQRLSGMLIAPAVMPADAVVTVQIENLTRPQWTVRNGHQVITAAQLREVPFQIAYDPQYVFPQDIYQVRAFVSSGGRNIYFTPQPTRVLTQGNPSQVQLRLEAVGGSTAAGTSGTLTGFANYNQIDDEVARLYRLYLGRPPSSAELAAARISFDDMKTLTERLPLKLMASPEYFDLAHNSRDFWFKNVFGIIVGRQPSPAEVTQWMQRFSELGFSRTELLRQLYAQAR